MSKGAVINSDSPEEMRTRYELLRANALGESNTSSQLLMFIRRGMCHWLRMLNAAWTTPAVDEAKPESLAAASILADAILDRARLTGVAL